MSQRQSLSISLQSLAVGPGTAYWLNLEQVEQMTDAVTFEQAAEFIDALYDIDPCLPIEDEVGGEEAEQDSEGNLLPPVEEEEFVSLAQQMLERAALCGTLDGSYECKIRVARSHQNEPYKLVIDNGEELQRVTEQGRASQTLIVKGEASASLELPVLGNLTTEWQGPVFDLAGVCPGPEIELLGSTLNFGKRVTGTLTAHFDTQYDLVTLKINGNEEGEPQPARVLAFYAGLVAEHSVEPPDVSDEDAQTRQLLCDEAGGDLNPTPDKVECYEIVESVIRCRCSSDIVDGYTTTTEHSITCPDGISCPGGESECRHFMGSRRITGGYAPCPDEEYQEGDVGDPEFYLQTCCEPVPPRRDLPPCRTIRQVFTGGMGISEEDAAMYPGAVFIAVGPAEGACGEIITTWQVAARDCCDEAEPLAWDFARSVSVIGKNTSGIVAVTGGRGYVSRSWTVSGQGIFLDAGYTMKTRETVGNEVYIYTDNTACGTFVISVTDGCTTANGWVLCTAGQWVLLGSWLASNDGFPATVGCEVDGDGYQIGADSFEVIDKGMMLREWVQCRAGSEGVVCADQDQCCEYYNTQPYQGEWETPCIQAGIDFLKGGTTFCNPELCADEDDSYNCYTCDAEGGMFQKNIGSGNMYSFHLSAYRRELYEWQC